MSPAAAPAFNFILYKTSFKQTHSKNEHVFEHGFLNCEIKGDFFFAPTHKLGYTSLIPVAVFR